MDELIKLYGENYISEIIRKLSILKRWYFFTASKTDKLILNRLVDLGLAAVGETRTKSNSLTKGLREKYWYPTPDANKAGLV